MSFFRTRKRTREERQQHNRPTLQTIHELECKVCPLNNAKVRSPKMEPTGSDHPKIYILGEAPGSEEDKKGRQFIGPAGDVLRGALPPQIMDELRWNNVIRTRPPDNRNPEWQEIEACRPFNVRDIEKTKPLAIFGFGNVPLAWALPDMPAKHLYISLWRGRRLPVRIGNHVCWFYPMFHPSYVLRNHKKYPRGTSYYKTHEGLMFKRDIDQAIAELDWLPPAEIEDANGYYNGITLPKTLDDVITALSSIREEPVLGIDLETNGLRPYTEGSKILSVAIGTYDKTVAFPLDHRESWWGKKERQIIDDLMVDYLFATPGIKVAHNLAFEQEWLAYFYGQKILRGVKWGDTQGQAYVLDERRAGLGLDFLCRQRYGMDLKNISNLNRAKLDEEPIEDVLKYNALDTKYTQRLYIDQTMDLENTPTLKMFYDREQVRRTPTMVQTQLRGIKVDQARTMEYGERLLDKIEKLESDVAKQSEIKKYERRFGEFEPGSPDKVTKLLRDIMDRSEGKRGDDTYTTKEDVLEAIGLPITDMILEYRKCVKLLGTYVTELLPGGRLVYPDGLLHTVLNTMFTETGRLSSEDPNIQNFPKRKDKWIRGQIIPRPGNILISADYGQIEPRVIAAWSGDPVLIQALWDDYDIHLHWAERIAKEFPAALKSRGNIKALRTDTKSNFVLAGFYGSEPNGIAHRMKMPESVVKDLLEEFWDMLKGVRKWQQGLIDAYWECGYVECATGRRRYGPLIGHRIVNTPVQGTASDIVVNAMNRISEMADEEDIDYLTPTFNIHDDLTFDVPDEFCEDVMDIIVEEMLAVPYRFMDPVPISVEVEAGYDWANMETIDVFSTNKKD